MPPIPIPPASTATTFRKTALAAALSSLFVCQSAVSGTIDVVEGGCTLIDAIITAESGSDTGACTGGTSGADTIVLPSKSTQTVTAVHIEYDGFNGLPPIQSSITIQGNGSTITRQDGSPDFRLFYVAESGDLTLQQTTLSGGSADDGDDDDESRGDRGGGIFNLGTLTLTNSTLSGNSATDDGGGLYNYRPAANATLTNCTVSGNVSGDQGGGIYNDRGAELTVVRSTISGNTAGTGGGIVQDGRSEVDSLYRSTLTVRNSTVSGNSATNFAGGGLYLDRGAAFLYDSTISGNTADEVGGGIYLFNANTVIERCLVSGNRAGDEYNEVYLGSSSPDYTLSRNFFGDSSETSGDAFGGDASFTFDSTDILATSDADGGGVALSSIIGPLADNGGPTMTHALLASSGAVDAVLSSDAACTGTDQRGTTRPQGSGCDIGAFEVAQDVAEDISISIGDVSASEGHSDIKKLRFKIRLSAAATSPVTVKFATANGSAKAGSDYTAKSGTVTFAAGEVKQQITILVKGDKTREPNETFFVNLSGASSGTTLADKQGKGTINNDD